MNSESEENDEDSEFLKCFAKVWMTVKPGDWTSCNMEINSETQ